MGHINCETGFIGRNYKWLDEIDSTNSLMRRMLMDEDVAEGLMLIADHQDAGRGRSGHTWSSPIGSSIALSVLLRPDVDENSIPIVTLVTALAVAKAIHTLHNIDVAIKWPNDIIVGGKKVCGILTELDLSRGVKSLIVGVGINANQESFPDEIKDVATSIKMITGKDCDRERLVEYFAACLEEYYKTFLKSGDMTELIDEYNSLLINIDREVKVLDPSENITGIAKGIDELGQLLVETDDKVTHHIYAGEVSVRGIYGYV